MGTILEQVLKEHAFPGAVWKVYCGDKLLFQESAGTLTYESDKPVTMGTRFDLASVTKPFVSTAVLILAAQGLIDLDAPAASYLEQMRYGEMAAITIKELLLHTAGLFSDPELHKDYPQKEHLLKQMFQRPLITAPAQKVSYTSIGYIFLGLIIERVSGLSLDQYLQKSLFEPLGLKTICFLPRDKANIAPTEFSVFRQRLLVGEVHDDNCYLLGGVCGHAGLFSDATDVALFGKALLDDSDVLMPRRWKEYLFTNYTPGMEQERSCAFVVNNKMFGSWECDTFSHNGFTGTSIFLAPKKKIVSVLLTNRVCPSRDNEKIDDVRLRLHTWLKDQVRGRDYE